MLLMRLYCIFSGQNEGSEWRLQQSLENDATDEKFGFVRYNKPQEIVGWLLNMHPVSIKKSKTFSEFSKAAMFLELICRNVSDPVLNLFNCPLAIGWNSVTLAHDSLFMEAVLQITAWWWLYCLLVDSYKWTGGRIYLCDMFNESLKPREKKLYLIE